MDNSESQSPTNPPAVSRRGVSRDGHEFDPRAPRWRLSKDLTLDLDAVVRRLTPALRVGYRATMKFYAQNYSPSYCSGIHAGVAKLLKDTGADGFPESVLRRYRANLDRKTEWRLGFIRAYLTRWHAQGYDGVSSEAVDYLMSLRLRGNNKGGPILTLDPVQGPFDDQELAAIIDAAAQHFEQGQIDVATLALILLLLQTGRRPGQLTQLRVADIRQISKTDESPAAELQVPRSKQRGRKPRDDFKSLTLERTVSVAVLAQRAVVVERIAARFGSLPPHVVAQLPLFPNWRQLEQLRSVKELEGALSNDALHITTAALRDRLRTLDVLSLRTGRRLRITPRRCRYTLGTRAAREGYGLLIIAELLDHSDVQSVRVYTRVHPNFRQKVDQAVGRQLAPLAKAFTRRVVNGEDRARNGGDPSMRVGTREDKVGTCGSQGFCGAQAAACYTCIHFQPWLEAPHEKMLAWFLAERQRAADAGAGEHVVAATDRSILGAQAVIAACEARKSHLAGDGS